MQPSPSTRRSWRNAAATTTCKTWPVTANERTISVCDGGRAAEGTRDDLLAAVRAAETYAKLWEILLPRAELDE